MKVLAAALSLPSNSGGLLYLARGVGKARGRASGDGVVAAWGAGFWAVILLSISLRCRFWATTLSSWDWSWLTSCVSSMLFLGEAMVSCEGVVRGGRLVRSIVKTEAG